MNIKDWSGDMVENELKDWLNRLVELIDENKGSLEYPEIFEGIGFFMR